MSEPFSPDSLPAPNTGRMADDPERRPASRRGMGGQEIDLQLRPERGECATLEIGCVSCPARGRGQGHINEDYVGVMLGDRAARAARGSVIALADGVSGSKGGRVAAELSVRTFIDAYYTLPDTLQPGVAAARARGNTWLAASDRPCRSCTESDGCVLCGADRAPCYRVSGSGRRCAAVSAAR